MPLATFSFDLPLIGKIIGGMVVAGLVLATLWFWIRKSKEPGLLLLKWLLTLPGLVTFFFLIRWLDKKIAGGVDYGGAVFGAGLAAVGRHDEVRLLR